MASKNLKKIFKKVITSRLIKQIAIIFGSILLLAAILFLGFNLAYNKRIFPHTYIGGINFGGKNYQDAQSTLLDLENTIQDESLSYSYQDEINQLSLKDLEVNFEQRNSETLTKLFEVGRSGSLGKILSEQFRSVFLKNQAYAVFNYSQEKLANFLQAIAQKIDKSPKDAAIEIQDQKASVIEAEIGQQFPREKNQQISLEQIGSFTLKGQLPFLIEPVYPEVSTAAAKMALLETENLINRHLILKAPKNTFHIYPQDIASLIEFPKKISKGVLGEQSDKEAIAQNFLTIYTISPELSTAKIDQLVEKIGSEIYQEPKDARFEVQAGRVVAFQLAQTGYELDKNQASAIIIQAIKDGQAKIELPVKVTESEYSDKNPASIGLKEKIGEGTTDFSGSPQNRR
ncbi:MAG: peptidoglycan binding domain-containing protein, partial [Patescibacteria group bacterium]